MISDTQKNIYNSFLHATRTVKNKPFTPRTKFSDLDNTTLLILKKLDLFFKSHRNINYNDFFIAPYSIYNKEDYFDLQFYITRRSIKCYVEYIKNRELDDPDNDNTILKCKESCAFIYYFCKQAGITLGEYKQQKSTNIPLVLQHIKEHKINFYTLHGLEINNILTLNDIDLYNFMFDNFNETYNTTRSKFIRSKKLKNTIRAALKIIDEKLLIFAKASLQ